MLIIRFLTNTQNKGANSLNLNVNAFPHCQSPEISSGGGFLPP